MKRLFIASLLAWLATLAQAAAPPLVVGSKRFTESYVLGELVQQTLQRAGVAAVHKPGLGNTGILEQALASGAVDVYPEYTGTIVRELLKRSDAADANPTLEQLNAWLALRGLKAAVPLGFNNTYALAVSEGVAQRLGLQTIGDLAKLAPGSLRLGLSHEFQQRADGWPALRAAYGLRLVPGAALDHGLAYAALEAAQVDLVDVYSTDAQLGRRAVRVLADERGFFPRYDAVLLMRAAVNAAPLQALAGRLDEAAMIGLNAQVEIDGLSFAEVARRWLDAPSRVGAAAAAKASSPASVPVSAPVSASVSASVPTPGRAGFADRLFAPDLGRLLLQHLALVFGSVGLAVVVAVPLGVAAWRRPRLAGVLLGTVGVLQTVPSLALLALLIAVLGVIGFVPALLALFVYALLPIVRNTHAGLAGVPAGLSLAGLALGLNARQVLRRVQLPLALPTLLAGVKTAAVLNVGTATVAAFVGAGGLGERIVAGLAVNDHMLMLAGALPAALLAVAVQWAFDAGERRWLRCGPR
ncbi:MAG: amino acid ABC transporter permease [Leptothrix sp. (in: Bacteria)]|nr:amino acid ABC transporter permease [Leptothrix sp. (in: b-proteobacteria)]